MSEELLHVFRGAMVENIHRGDIVVVDYKGKITAGVGDAGKLTYFRSAAKPFLALNVILSGAAEHYGFTDRELAIMCASHRGEEYHVEVLESIVDKVGLPTEVLHCGIAEPFSRPAAIKMYRDNQSVTPLHCNCSGKHLAMLAVCKYKGDPLENYYTISHPVQQDGLTILEKFTGVDKQEIIIGIDGCTVPVHGIPLYNMALAYARLANPCLMGSECGSAVHRLTNAIMTNPDMLSGQKAFCTDLMTAGHGDILGKVGADGVYCISLPKQGLGIAVKIEDGDTRSGHIVAANTLKQMGLLSPQQLASLAKYLQTPVVDNYKNEVGKFKAIFDLHLTLEA